MWSTRLIDLAQTIYLHDSIFFLQQQPPPRSTLFPYTTLFRSDPSSTPTVCVSNSASSRASKRSAKDRKSTRLNSSHPSISYDVFCFEKQNVCTPVTSRHRMLRSA